MRGVVKPLECSAPRQTVLLRNRTCSTVHDVSGFRLAAVEVSLPAKHAAIDGETIVVVALPSLRVGDSRKALVGASLGVQRGLLRERPETGDGTILDAEFSRD